MPRVKLLDPNDERRRLGRYELIGEIAAGGMATVHLARLPGVGGFQRFVAIKQLHPHLADEQEFVEMFLDEARLAAGIHHPNVVSILEVGESEFGYFLVMEYVEGDTLGRLLARAAGSATPVPYAVSIRVLLDALHGLHAAHDLLDPSGAPLQLVHRDVSPQNILVGIDGVARLTDFGVARASSRIANTRSDTLKGKLAYMSPEQAKSMPLDRRSDVFAMGVVLWECLTGRRLLKADSEAGTLARLLMEPLPTLLDAVPTAHPALDAVCTRALSRDLDHRFQSALEMADALEAAAREAARATMSEVGIASPREVSTFVRSLLEQEIVAHRDSVRTWLTQTDPSAVLPTSVRRSTLIGLPRSSPSPRHTPAPVGPEAAASPVSPTTTPSEEAPDEAASSNPSDDDSADPTRLLAPKAPALPPIPKALPLPPDATRPRSVPPMPESSPPPPASRRRVGAWMAAVGLAIAALAAGWSLRGGGPRVGEPPPGEPRPGDTLGSATTAPSTSPASSPAPPVTGVSIDSLPSVGGQPSASREASSAPTATAAPSTAPTGAASAAAPKPTSELSTRPTGPAKPSAAPSTKPTAAPAATPEPTPKPTSAPTVAAPKPKPTGGDDDLSNPYK
jgi:serine/threonine protein kinase